MTLTYGQDIKTRHEQPYRDQVKAIGDLPSYYVVWVAETSGSNYGYHRAVYKTFSDAHTGGIAIINSGQFANAADRTAVLKINKDNQYEYEDRHVYSQDEFVCMVQPGRSPWISEKWNSRDLEDCEG